MKATLHTDLDRLLREAAKKGDPEALKAWRLRHGYPAKKPDPDLPRQTVTEATDFDPSWYPFGDNRENKTTHPREEPLSKGRPTWQPKNTTRSKAAALKSERRGRWEAQRDALEEAFAAGLTDEPFTDSTPEAHRARLAALDAANAALAEADAKLRQAAKAGRSRRDLWGLRQERGRKEAALRRVCQPQTQA